MCGMPLDSALNLHGNSSARAWTKSRYSPVPSSVASDSETEDRGSALYFTEFIELKAPDHFFERWRAGEFTIVPENNPAVDVWDVIVITALLVTALAVPYEVAYLDEEPRGWVLWMGRAVDFVFCGDMILTFQLAYPVSSAVAKDSYEKAPIKIMQRYMAFPLSDNMDAGWFWVDMVTLIPWQMLFSGAHMQLLRILRLIRMFRLVRVVKLFNRWHAHFGMSYKFFSLAQCFVCSLLTLHWFACAWGSVAFSVGDHGDTWLSRRAEFDGRTLESYHHWEIYNLALYFSTMTLTSVGFGDIRAANDREVFLATCMMLLTGFLWSFVLASTVHVVTNMDIYTIRFHDRMDELNLMMQNRDLDHMFRWRVRKYMHESFHVHRQMHHQETIQWLSVGLQGELAVQSGLDKVFSTIWYLRDLHDDVLVELASHLKALMYGPNEFVLYMSKALVIRKGSCMQRGRILTRDSAVGVDMIVSTDFLRDTPTTKTLTFLEAVSLSRKDLFLVCDNHPDFSRRIRRAQIKLAMWRGVVYAARQSKVKGSKWDRLWKDFHAHETRIRAAMGAEKGQGSDPQVLRELQRLASLTESGVRRMAALEARFDGLEGRLWGAPAPAPAPRASPIGSPMFAPSPLQSMRGLST